MDVNRLRRGEKIAGVAAIALLIVMFLDWYAQGINDGVAYNAWQAFDVIDFILFLIALIAIGQAALTATQRSPALPVAGSVVTTVAGGLGTLLVIFRLVDQPFPNELINTKLGAFLGLIALAAIAYGGFDAMRDETSPAVPQPEPETRPAPAPTAPTPEAAPAAATAAAGAETPAAPPTEAGNPAPPGEGATEPPASEEPLAPGPGETPREEPPAAPSEEPPRPA